ncbi:GNAT family N-acetyltransferase [Paenalkalicoccus suaedae]|uniref:GNAT family N-acetyltransferase n=1 Tax=Paenalkalicoccus suaedae TaxID=2592382 RepID=A0A859FIK0_9BACI|nr:GNAT family N-acetyltransferase [Paenalkalicoccus suaedae]QKS72700.1 GNAT family N-acetyltransferase [Paenalkalicoccus suaedae]
MEIRQLTAKDATIYQSLRLEALQSAPEAFASSYEEEVDYSNELIEHRLTQQTSYTLGAFENDHLVGMVTLIFSPKRKIAHRASIVGMYVDATARKKGVGDQLVKEIMVKANSLPQIESLHLSVTATNEPAKALYKRHGFTTYGLEEKALKIDDVYYDEELMINYLPNKTIER